MAVKDLRREAFERTDALWIVALLLTVGLDRNYAAFMTTALLAISVVSLGLPETFRRSQAMMLSRGRILFSHLISLVLCAAATAAAACLSPLLPFHHGGGMWYSILAGSCILSRLSATHLRAKRRFALAALTDLLGALTIAAPACMPEHIYGIVLASEGVTITSTLLSVSVAPRAAPSPSAGLLKEIPGALFVQIYYPALCGFGMMMWLDRIGYASVERLWAEHIYGYLAGLLLLALFRPLFRREASDTPWALDLSMLLCIIAGGIGWLLSPLPGTFPYLVPAFLFIAGGCALTVFHAPTLVNILTEILWILAGLYAVIECAMEWQELAIAGGLALAGVLVQIKNIADGLHKFRLRHIK